MHPLVLNPKLLRARQCMQSFGYAEALGLYGDLAKEFPAEGTLWDEYGRAAATAGAYNLADEIWQRMLNNEPKSAGLRVRIAGEYGKIWQFAKARAVSRQAAELEPRDFDAQLNLASLLSKTGGVEEARPAVERCLKMDPGNEQARCLAAHLSRRENKLIEAEQQFRDVLASGMRDPYAAFFCHMELARTLDKMERFDEAINFAQRGKKLIAQGMNIDESRKIFTEWCHRMLNKARSFRKDILATWSKQFPADMRSPIPPVAFLGGHARSGTTLLERILDAHPSVAACDEALAFKTVGPLIDVTLPEIPAQQLNFVRKRYVSNLVVGLEPPPEGKTLVDKNPAMTAFLPTFLRAFPELRVIVALRDPRDVLVSCYFEDITRVSHLSMEALGDHYSAVMGVWLAVREWEGLAAIQTRYEDIVVDLQKEGSRITKFIGLEWHADQASFHAKNREKPIMSTTNYSSVTQPIYSKSVGRWRAYEKYLSPALPKLEPFCKEFGYS